MKRLVSRRLSGQIHRVTAQSAYGDSAIYYPPLDPNSGLDEYGQPAVSSSPSFISCSFTDLVKEENWREFGNIGSIDAEIRFDGVEPLNGGKFKLTKHFDLESYKDVELEVVAVRDRGPFGYVCALRKVSI